MASSTNKKRKKKKEANKGSAGLLIAAGVGVIALLLCCSGSGVGGYFLWFREPGKAPKIADADKNIDKVADKNVDKAVKPPTGEPIIIAMPASSRDLAYNSRWAKGAAAEKLLLGGHWVATGGHNIQFNPGATYDMMTTMGVGSGRYKFVPPHHLEFDHMPSVGSKEAKVLTKLSGIVLVDNDELIVLWIPPTMRLKTNNYLIGIHCYRLRPDGTGSARAKVLDPAIEDTRSVEVLKRSLGLRTLRGCGPDAWPAFPEVLNVVDTDPNFRSDALGILGNLGPKAKGAVPSLRAIIRDRNHPHRLNTIKALGKIGPAARDAIPDLTPYLKDAYPPTVETARDALRLIDPKGKY